MIMMPGVVEWQEWSKSLKEEAVACVVSRHHLIPAFLEDPLPVLLAVPHLAHQEGVKAFALELVAFHHHQLHRAFSVLELCNMLLCGKAGHFLIITEALC